MELATYFWSELDVKVNVKDVANGKRIFIVAMYVNSHNLVR